MHQKDVPKPEDLMTGDWEESWIEVEGEVGEITSCPRCGSRIERKAFDVDFLDGKITVHGFGELTNNNLPERYHFSRIFKTQINAD